MTQAIGTLLFANTLLLTALWPAWDWWMSRGAGTFAATVVCLAAATILLFRRRVRCPHLGLPAAFLAGFAVAQLLNMPPIVPALLAVSSIAALLSSAFLDRSFSFPFAGLLWLSMPVSGSLDFFLGFPLRVLSGGISALLLSPWGVELSGTALICKDIAVSVDAPCSGVRMLWQAMFVICILGTARNLSFLPFAVLSVASFMAVLVANAARATALYFTEAGIVSAPKWTHEAAGVLCFICALTLIYWIASHVERRWPKPPPVPSTRFTWGNSKWVFGGVCLLCLALPLASEPKGSVKGLAQTDRFPGWPETMDARELVPLELTPNEASFAREFPGKVARFQCGGEEVILRWVSAPTRMLHPASECLRASGYYISELPQLRDGEGRLWSRFEARKVNETLEVRELIRDQAGQSWPDASAWFWSAFLGKSKGPWWSVTVCGKR